jgi:type VI secretion system ImpJ/VasE family protein
MSTTPQIHWHEGLFLQPHHLQRFQKNIVDQFGAERRLGWTYGYGVVEAKLSHDDLQNHRLRFQKLTVVMPGGAVLSYPDNTVLPSLDIRDAFSLNPKGFTVYLGLPHWFEARANTVEGELAVGSRIKQLYRVPNQVPEIKDENTGENPQPMQFRLYNAMLLLDSDDDSDIEKIPLMRIVHDVSREEPFPRQDPNYVHPCLLLSASPVLREMVKDLTSQVEATREQLANIVARGGEIHGISRAQLEQVLRLRCLNRFVARMPALLAFGDGNADVPPFEVYQELQTLLADLMALFPERSDFLLIPYDHEHPYPPFLATITRIRNYLQGSVKPDYWEVKFEAGSDVGVRSARLEEKHFTEPNAWFLGIKTSLEPSNLIELVEDTDQFKLMPRSFLERAIRGIVLKEERFPPLELPAESGRYYFRLNVTQSRRVWDEAMKELELVIRWSMQREVPDFQMSLFMTVSGADKDSDGGRRSR